MKFKNVSQFIKLLNIIWWNSTNNAQKSPVYIAVEKGNLEIVRLLLSRTELNINERSIYNQFFLFDFKSFFVLISFQNDFF